ncbi:hypothetical protein HMI56_007194 [Coelomomyces lativittatus]|nr:hypothetical protein HMI56_007194 [Coelomomyces lativittatus]
MNRPHKRSLVTSPLLDSKDLRLPIHTSTPVSVHGNEPQIGTWAVGVNEEIEGLPHEEKDPSIPPSKRIRRGSSEVSTTAPIALSTDPKDRMLPTFGPLDPLGPLYTHGTQYRFWRFSSGQIIELRRQTHETAVQESLEVLREHPESWTKDDFLTPDEEYELIQHFMEQSALVCRKFKLNDLVRATALMCMRRFYLKKSVLFYDPKTVMYVSWMILLLLFKLFLSVMECIHRSKE